VRDSDHAHNLARCSQLTGAVRGLEPRQLTGRTGWRWSTDDRLPVLGAVPDIPTALTLNRMEQTAQVPRLPGLYVCTAFGSRGVTWAALAAQVVAAQISGAALPIEVDLLDAVDAARFVARSARAHR
jgi:tRNA 5-methylaminomethyl-2-thiouridine biosynthesis bifunctional protein